LDDTAADDPTPSAVFYDANRKGGRPASAIGFGTLQKVGNGLVSGSHDEVRNAVAGLLPFDLQAHADKMNMYVAEFLHLTGPWCKFSCGATPNQTEHPTRLYAGRTKKEPNPALRKLEEKKSSKLTVVRLQSFRNLNHLYLTAV
jgi:hypothetical protein